MVLASSTHWQISFICSKVVCLPISRPSSGGFVVLFIYCFFLMFMLSSVMLDLNRKEQKKPTRKIFLTGRMSRRSRRKKTVASYFFKLFRSSSDGQTTPLCLTGTTCRCTLIHDRICMATFPVQKYTRKMFMRDPCIKVPPASFVRTRSFA